MDKSRPVNLNVSRLGDAVLLRIGTRVVSIPVETAKTLAEAILGEVATIQGVAAYIISVGQVDSTVRAQNPSTVGAKKPRDSKPRRRSDAD